MVDILRTLLASNIFYMFFSSCNQVRIWSHSYSDTGINHQIASGCVSAFITCQVQRRVCNVLQYSCPMKILVFSATKASSHVSPSHVKKKNKYLFINSPILRTAANCIDSLSCCPFKEMVFRMKVRKKTPLPLTCGYKLMKQ